MTGGGSLGPVTPLIAVAEEWRRRDPDVQVSWIGTMHGPERMIVEEAGFAFHAIAAAKLSRHKKWSWPFIPFFLLLSFVQSILLLRKLKPDAVFTAGGYVSVPVIITARLMGMVTWVHQLDLKPGLANKLMAPFAKRISVTWLDSLELFPESKTRQVGAVVRPEVLRGDKTRAVTKYALDSKKPTIFVLGGGTGAQSINEAMAVIAPDILKRANVIHLMGKGKMVKELESIPGYVALELIGKDIADLYAAADIVVARAGMGTILEIAALRKPAILIPLPNEDQISNANAMQSAEACTVLWELNGQILKQEIVHLLEDAERRFAYAEAVKELFVKNGEERIVNEALDLLAKT